MKKLWIVLLLTTCLFAQSTGMKPMLGTQLDWGNPLTKGLVGAWFNQEAAPVGGTLYDLSGNSNHGTLVGDTHSVPGKFGPALEFDGTNDWVDCGANSSIKPTGAMTISFWAKGISNSPSAGTVGTMGGSPNRGFLFGPDDGDRLIYQIASDDSTTVSLEDNGSFSTDGTQWEHYIAVYSPSTFMRIYWNGILVGEKTAGIPVAQYQANGTSVKIGNRGDGAADFIGQISDVTIYDRALNAGEIKELYRYPFQMFKQERMPIAVAAAPPSGGRSFGVIIASIPFGLFGIGGIALAFGCAGRKAA